MSRKDTLLYNVLPAGTSLSASFKSPATVIRYTDNVSYQIAVTTTDSAGTFSVQVSDDYAVSPDNSSITNAGTWDTLTLSGVPTVSSASDIITISLNQLPFFAIRLVYTSTTAGTGTCQAYITSKQLGG
jgi:hypothetical protein